MSTDDHGTGELGYLLSFTTTGEMFQPMATLALIAGLHGKDFSGYCECYIRPGTDDGEYLTALWLRPDDEHPLTAQWWESLLGCIAHACSDDSETNLATEKCRPMPVEDMRRLYADAGSAVFEDGNPIYADGDPESPFVWLCRRVTDEEEVP